MTRVLIPRSDAVSAKAIIASDTEKILGHLGDFVCTGMAIAAQCPNVLAVDVGLGVTRMSGLWLCSDATEAVTCLTACDVNYIFTQINRDCCCEPCNFTVVTNICCMPSADQFLIGNATTNCATVTAVCNFRAQSTSGGNPTGSITMFGGTISTVPTGWLLANGASRNITTCAALFAVIGVQFGGSGCNFCLPDMQSSFTRGAPSCCEPGGTGGSDTVTLASAESGIVTHQHIVTAIVGCGPNSSGPGGFAYPSGTNPSNGTCNVAAMCGHENRPSYLEMLYIIKT